MTRAEQELAALGTTVLVPREPIDALRARARRWRRRQRLRFGSIGMAIVAVSVGGFVMFVEPRDAPPSVVAGSSQKGQNYLVIGSDARTFVNTPQDAEAFGAKGEVVGQRADMIMMMHVDSATKEVVVVSFPRDLWLEVPGAGMAKLNTAFNQGPGTLIATIEQNFDIAIDHYFEVDFKGFRKVVDAIGSVPVYFPYPARDLDSALTIEAGGCIRLNAREALAYVRSRHLEYYSSPDQGWYSADAEGDIARIGRQQHFLRQLGIALRNRAADPFSMNKVADAFIAHIKVDDALTKEDLLELIEVVQVMGSNDADSSQFFTVPWTPGEVEGMSVLVPSETDLDAALRSSNLGSQATGSAFGTTRADFVGSPLGPPARSAPACR